MRRSLPQSFFSLLASVLIWGGLAPSDTQAQDNTLPPPELAEGTTTTSPSSTTLWPSTPGSNRFGNRIAVDGDTVLIGAPEHAMWYPHGIPKPGWCTCLPVTTVPGRDRWCCTPTMASRATTSAARSH